MADTAPGRRLKPPRRAASERRKVDRFHRLPSPPGYDRDNCGRRNKPDAPETCPRQQPAVRSWLCSAPCGAPARSHLAFLPGNLSGVPVKDLLAVPVHDTVELVDVIIDCFEIFDAKRLPADVGMDRQRHDF